MSDVGSELGNEVQVSGLPRSVFVCVDSKGIRQGFVITEDKELTAFNENLISEVLDREIDSEEFPVKRAVSCFGRA